MIAPRTLALAAAAVACMAAPALAGDAQPACSGPTCSGACANVVDTAAQERLGELVTRQRDELVNLARTLEGERKRQIELESELAVARAAAVRQPQPVTLPQPESGGNAAMQDENRRLRQENERLASKLRAAGKVADLVFRDDDDLAEQAEGEARAEAPAMPRWIAPPDASPEKSTAWTRELDNYKQPTGPSPEKSTVWTREAMGY